MPIVPLIMAANADPRMFPEPEKLIVDRLSVGSEKHVGFDKGIHRCLGQHAAYLEAEVALRGAVHPVPGPVSRSRAKRSRGFCGRGSPGPRTSGAARPTVLLKPRGAGPGGPIPGCQYRVGSRV
ncbi:hypothetical protein AB0M80_02665 [Amycolatopsis sp. NPDC051045]|uniref:hypothetical protein n=1 Tax=Amycolatopsis sp. NPDC051045 TaxID=3156922 RepID=UPI003415380C